MRGFLAPLRAEWREFRADWHALPEDDRAILREFAGLVALTVCLFLIAGYNFYLVVTA